MKRLTVNLIPFTLIVMLAGAVLAKGNFVHKIGTTPIPRAAHTATRIGNNVLIAGGMQEDGVSTPQTIIYMSRENRFVRGAEMTIARAGHSATLLSDDRVLVLGGFDGRSPVSSAEVYELQSGVHVFTSIGDAPVSGGGFTATLLNDGRVLIVGGGESDAAVAETYLFDPETDAFEATGAMSTPRNAHTATLLDDGRVLIAGGTDGTQALASAEIYDPAAGEFTATGDLLTARHKHGAVRMADGRVLIVGGSTEDDWRTRLTSAEIFDPTTGEFSATASLLTPRFKLADAVTLLDDGKVLVAGGGMPEMYDPETGTFAHVLSELTEARYFSTATHLPDDSVLILGGYTQDIRVTADAWLYLPVTAF